MALRLGIRKGNRNENGNELSIILGTVYPRDMS
jgi:hypothetical protein